MPVGRVGCRHRLCNCLTVWSIWIACASFTACGSGPCLCHLFRFRGSAPMKFKIDEFVCDVLIEMGHDSMPLIPDAMQSGFQEIYRIEPSAPRCSAVCDAIRIEMEGQPSATKVMLYGGPALAALNKACENSQNKLVAVKLSNSRADYALDVHPYNYLGLEGEIRVIRHWFHDNILHPIVIVSDIVNGHCYWPISKIIDELLEICPQYYFQILDSASRRNVLVAVPPACFHAYAAGGVISKSGNHGPMALSGQD